MQATRMQNIATKRYMLQKSAWRK